MCGLYGMLSLTGDPLRYPELVPDMGQRLQHRGPDASGEIVRTTVALGCRRLNVVQPGPAADQPFVDPRTESVMVGNGEIYNAGTLRRLEADYPFRGRGDLEPLLPFLLSRGAAGLADVEGMYAVALWDQRRRSLLLARDRAGEKPLFLLEQDGEMWFASEPGALLVHPALRSPALDTRAVRCFLTLGYVPEPLAAFAGIRQVRRATCLVIDPTGARTVTRIAYPDPHPVSGDPSREVRGVMQRAIIAQTRSDVPLGVFASGGLDSSLIASTIAHHQPAPPLLITARFADPSFDESGWAHRLGRDIGADVCEVTVDDDALARALEWATSLSQPIADPALLPTLLLAEAARERVGVVLSGEGADELFGGYPTYLGHRNAGWYRRVPRSARRMLDHLLRHRAAAPNRLPVAYLWLRFSELADEPWLPRHLSWFGTGLWPHLPPEWRREVLDILDDSVPADSTDAVAAAMALDFATYLPDNLLPKFDRATMHFGLEGRAPFLDANVVACARALPASAKVTRTRTKVMLHRAARGVVPPWVLRRRKRGFSVPVGRWINEGLRPEVDALLESGTAIDTSLEELPVSRLLAEHRAGRANHQRALWAIITLQRWVHTWV